MLEACYGHESHHMYPQVPIHPPLTTGAVLSSDLPQEIKEEVIIQYFQLNKNPSVCSSICLANKSISLRVSPLFQRVKGPHAFLAYHKSTSIIRAVAMNLSREKIEDIVAALHAEDLPCNSVRSIVLVHVKVKTRMV